MIGVFVGVCFVPRALERHAMIADRFVARWSFSFSAFEVIQARSDGLGRDDSAGREISLFVTRCDASGVCSRV